MQPPKTTRCLDTLRVPVTGGKVTRIYKRRKQTLAGVCGAMMEVWNHKADARCVYWSCSSE